MNGLRAFVTRIIAAFQELYADEEGILGEDEELAMAGT
jgi:hypothetical protein